MQTQYNVLFKYSYLGFNTTAILYTTSFGVVLALPLLITELPKKLSAFVIPGIGYYNVTAAINSVVLIIHLRQPWLCASPDGLLKDGTETVLLEIKCPYKIRNDLIISPAKEESHVDYIGYEGGQLKLKRRHYYYTQVQIAMYVTNTRECFFCVCVHLPAEYNCRG